MCHHLYLKHSCGHKTVSVEQCNPTLTSTAALFCDNYRIYRAGSIKKCGGLYCKEDREQADWIENGLAKLFDCDHEIHDLMRRLETYQRRLKTHSRFEAGWGPVQDPKMVKENKDLREHAVDLIETLKDRKERRKYILHGMETTKAKLSSSAQTLAQVLERHHVSKQQELQQRQMLAQYPQPAPTFMSIPKPIHSLNMPAVQQPVVPVQAPRLMPKFIPMPSSNVAITPTTSGMPAMQMPVSGQTSGRFQIQQTKTHPRAQVWLPNDLRPIQPRLSHADNKKMEPRVTQSRHSPQLNSPAFTPLTPVLGAKALPKTKVSPSKTSPPKKRIGRPPKTKTAEEEAPETGELNKTQTTPAKQNRRKAATKFQEPSPGTRRSGRLSGKQDISYAESSTSASPEPVEEKSMPRQVKTAVKLTKEVSAMAGLRRSTRKRNSKAQEEDEEFPGREDEFSSEAETVLDEDEEWQDQDAHDQAVSPIKTGRTNKKPDQKLTPKANEMKRGAAESPTTPAFNKKPKLDTQVLTEDIAMMLQPSATKAQWYLDSPIKWSVDSMPSPWPVVQMSNAQVGIKTHTTPKANLRGGQAPDLSTPSTTKSLSKNLTYTPTNFFPDGRLQDSEVVSLGASELTNGMPVEGDVLLPVDDFDDDNMYDFDVAEMSKIAGL